MRLKNTILPTLIATAMSAHSAVLYSEAFPNTSDPQANEPTATVGWANYLGATAITTANSGSAPRWAISNAPGPSGSKGYLFRQTSTEIGVAYEDTAFSLLPANITDFTFISTNNSSTGKARFIVQQDGNWFVSNTELGTQGDYNSFFAGPSALSLTFDTLSTSWKSLTINPTVELSIGAATALSGTLPITRIGLYTSGTDVIRIDDVTINGAVPEPSTALLLSALGSLALLRRRVR